MHKPINDQEIEELKESYWKWFTEETSYLTEWTYKIFELEKDYSLMKNELGRKKKLPNRKKLEEKSIGIGSKINAVLEKYYGKKMAERVEIKIGKEKWEVFRKLTFLELEEEIKVFKKIKSLLEKIFREIKADITYSLGKKDFEAEFKKLLLLNPNRFDFLSKKIGTSTDKYIKKKFTSCYEKFRGSRLIRTELFRYFPTCPYCNFNYLSKLEEKDDGKDYYALEVDHYYPKDKYPYLAISIFNLIPSCPTCNGIKNNNTDPHLNPYYEEMGKNAKFEMSIKCFGELRGMKFKEQEEFDRKVELKIIDRSHEYEGEEKEKYKRYVERIENSKEIFELENKYSNATHEIKDLYFKHLLYSRKKELMKSFGDELGLNEKDMKEVYFGTIEKEKEHKRPLSKFTNDIIDFLGD